MMSRICETTGACLMPVLRDTSILFGKLKAGLAGMSILIDVATSAGTLLGTDDPRAGARLRAQIIESFLAFFLFGQPAQRSHFLISYHVCPCFFFIDFTSSVNFICSFIINLLINGNVIRRTVKCCPLSVVRCPLYTLHAIRTEPHRTKYLRTKSHRQHSCGILSRIPLHRFILHRTSPETGGHQMDMASYFIYTLYSQLCVFRWHFCDYVAVWSIIKGNCEFSYFPFSNIQRAGKPSYFSHSVASC